MFSHVLVVIIWSLLLSASKNLWVDCVMFSSDPFFKFAIEFTVFSLQMLCAEFK